MRLEPKDHKQKDSEISLIGGLFDRLIVCSLTFSLNKMHSADIKSQKIGLKGAIDTGVYSLPLGQASAVNERWL